MLRLMMILNVFINNKKIIMQILTNIHLQSELSKNLQRTTELLIYTVTEKAVLIHTHHKCQ